MDAQLKQKWLEALRSGTYKQGQGRLYNGRDNSFCCLGVLCDVSGIPREDIRPWGTLDGYGRRDLVESDDSDHTAHLMFLNDCDGKTFAEIADWIEKHIPAEAQS